MKPNIRAGSRWPELQVLESQAERARDVAAKTLAQARKAVGLGV